LFTSEIAYFGSRPTQFSPHVFGSIGVTKLLCPRIPNRSIYMNLSYRITMDPEIAHGKPTVRGLRYTVESILKNSSGV